MGRASITPDPGVKKGRNLNPKPEEGLFGVLSGKPDAGRARESTSQVGRKLRQRKPSHLLEHGTIYPYLRIRPGSNWPTMAVVVLRAPRPSLRRAAGPAASTRALRIQGSFGLQGFGL